MGLLKQDSYKLDSGRRIPLFELTSERQARMRRVKAVAWVLVWGLWSLAVALVATETSGLLLAGWVFVSAALIGMLFVGMLRGDK